MQPPGQSVSCMGAFTLPLAVRDNDPPRVATPSQSQDVWPSVGVDIGAPRRVRVKRRKGEGGLCGVTAWGKHNLPRGGKWLSGAEVCPTNDCSVGQVT